MAQNQQQALLDALKRELKFCERSGYETFVGRLPARASENDPLSMDRFDERKRGDTVATLGGPGDAPEVQETVLDWLQRKIQQIEPATGQPQQPAA